ncbi:hypothetical protein ES332_A03G151100v1, partial [Gossypium tomentosum]
FRESVGNKLGQAFNFTLTIIIYFSRLKPFSLFFMLLPSNVIINKFPTYQFNFFNPISSQPYLPLTNPNKAFNLITAFLTPNALNKAFSCFRLRWKLEKRNKWMVVRYEASAIAEKRGRRYLCGEI